MVHKEAPTRNQILVGAFYDALITFQLLEAFGCHRVGKHP